MRKSAVLLLLLSLLAFCCLAQAQGKLDRIGRFPSLTGELQVSTYVEGNDRVGLLGIWRDQPPRAATAFRTGGWEALLQLWAKARTVRYKSWEHVGIYKEVGTTDPTLLTVTAGPGIRITMETEDGAFSAVLRPEDYDVFEMKLQQVRQFLKGDSAAQ
jgi:hypothetical protein